MKIKTLFLLLVGRKLIEININFMNNNVFKLKIKSLNYKIK
jgi:hypothetical protein